jgi:hypothetical protein
MDPFPTEDFTQSVKLQILHAQGNIAIYKARMCPLSLQPQQAEVGQTNAALPLLKLMEAVTWPRPTAPTSTTAFVRQEGVS